MSNYVSTFPLSRKIKAPAREGREKLLHRQNEFDKINSPNPVLMSKGSGTKNRAGVSHQAMSFANFFCLYYVTLEVGLAYQFTLFYFFGAKRKVKV